MAAALALVVALAVAATPPPPPRDVSDDDVKSADLAMSRAVESRDAAAFAAFLEAEAIFASAGGLARGRDAVLAAWKGYLTTGGPTLAWRPERAIVASSGDAAVTTGRFTWSGTADGKPSRIEGEYATVWRRGGDRRWRVLLDASLEPASALGPGLVREPVRSVTSAARDLDATLGTWRRGAEEGAFLTVRRGRGSERRTEVDSAFAFRRRRSGRIRRAERPTTAGPRRRATRARCTRAAPR